MGDWGEDVGPTRRAALGFGAAFVGVVLSPVRARAQWPTISQISQASLDARRDMGRLVRRADNLLRQVAADGAENPAGAVRRFLAERAALSRNFATLLNSRVSEDDWPLLVPTGEADLQAAIQPLAIRLAPSNEAVEAALATPLPKARPGAGEGAADFVMALTFACLGLEREWPNTEVLFRRLKEDGAVRAALDSVASTLRGHRYGVAAFEFEHLLRLVTSAGNGALIADLLGRQGLRAVYGGLVLYFVPFAGWSYFTAYVLASLYDSRGALESVLR